MFTKSLRLLSYLALILIVSGCGRIAPIQNQNNRPVPAGLSQNQVLTAIKLGASAKGWSTTQVRPGLMEANIAVRNHKAVVRIPYSNSDYSIVYENSENLLVNGKGSIHHNYNRWVKNLDSSIQHQLILLSAAK